jgi:hypothetical protein
MKRVWVLALSVLLAAGCAGGAGVQGITNLDSLTLSEDLTVGDDLAAGGDLYAYGDVYLGDSGDAANGTQVRVKDAGQTIDLGNYSGGKYLRIDAANGLVSGGLLSLKIRKPVTAYTVTHSLAAADTNGLFTNMGASGALTMTLPAAQAGYNYCVYVAAGQAVYVDPATGDQIASLTDAAGDRISNAAAGSSICLVAADTTNWLPLAPVGAWADAN